MPEPDPAAPDPDDERIAAIVRRVLTENAPPAAPAPPASVKGGGENVPANQMQEKAGNLVTELVSAVTEAAVRAGRKEGGRVDAGPLPPAAPASPVKKRFSFFGEDE